MAAAESEAGLKAAGEQGPSGEGGPRLVTDRHGTSGRNNGEPSQLKSLLALGVWLGGIHLNVLLVVLVLLNLPSAWAIVYVRGPSATRSVPFGSVPCGFCNCSSTARRSGPS